LDTRTVSDIALRVVAASNGRTAAVIRSTVLPGTAAAIEARLRCDYADATVIANPEFLREGYALEDFERPARRLIGGTNEEAVRSFASLYSFSTAPCIVTDPTTAELVKVAANAALALRVSMANEIADVANGLGVDPDAVLAAVGADPRIGSEYLRPGIGFGGTCLPKDLGAYRAIGRVVHARTGVFDGAAATNVESIERLTDRVVGLLNGCPASVCVVGLGFKRGSDQVRDSPALSLVEALLHREISVAVHDPIAESNARLVLRERVSYLPELSQLSDEHGVVVFTQGMNGTPPALPPHAIAIDGTGRLVTAGRMLE
jgi:UDPglucose 6-dehydrogenase